MEGIDEGLMKHVCKFCNKSFSSGRSLGGHVRSHVINSSDHHQIGNKSCSSVLDKLCKECGKGFQSWKALFGHMKCHSKKINHASLNQDSWISDLDIENPDVKIRRLKRSKSGNRRNKRYKGASKTTLISTASSSISINANNNQISSNNASTSMVSEIEQEQEVDVAVSLMMLSRDFGNWGNEIESSDYCKSPVLVKSSKAEGKDLRKIGSKWKNLTETEVGFDFLGRSEVGFIKYDGFDLGFNEFEDSSKRKFECVTCNKTFHSYQALGGHKASHKKLKGGDFNSKIKIEHQPMFDHDHSNNGYDSKTSEDHHQSSSFNLGVGCLKKKVVLGAHECPICLKIFPSGQALGGHKRSHLTPETKPNQENTTAMKKPDDPIRETRRFLDLNMPPEEEMVIMGSSTTYKSYFWEDTSAHHNHESTLLGLLSSS